MRPCMNRIHCWWPRVLGGASALLGVVSVLVGTIGALAEKQSTDGFAID